MNLVVYGREDVSTLLNMVNSSFSAIRNTGVAPITYDTVAFPVPYIGRIILYSPQANIDTLTMYWQTESLDASHRSAVSLFISHYLGYEGEGSVMQFLQTRSLASALSAGVEVNADSFSLFRVQITLTEEGLANVSDVIQIVFQFLRLLQNMTAEEFQTKWDDVIRVGEVLFDFAEKQYPNVYAQ